jgi:hypothetical protein
MCDAKTLLRILGLIVTVLLVSNCGHEAVPPELIGTWTTSAPLYETASMEITADTITFRDGKGYAGVNRITDIEKREEKEGTLVKMGYEGDEGVHFVLSFYLKKVKKGTAAHPMIVYKNQKNLKWTKEAG